MSRGRSRWFLLVLMIATVPALLILLPQYSAATAQQSSSNGNFFLFEYGSSRCPHCVPLHEFFAQNYDDHQYFCDIATNKTCLEYFNNFLNATGIPAYIPQTIIIKDGRIVAIVIGEIRDKTFWDSLISRNATDKIPVYLETEVKGYILLSLDKQPLFIKEYIPLPYDVIAHGGFVTHTSSTITTKSTTASSTETTITNTSTSTLTKPITTTTSSGGGSSSKGKGLAEMLGFLVPLALTDSVNPCTFVLYAVMLVSVSVSGSRGKVAAIGVAFVAAVMTGYFILGLGLSEVASFLPRQLILVVAFAYAAFIIVRALRDLRRGSRPGNVCREDDPECKAGRLARMFSSKVSILAAFAIGLLASFTLLPCSAGPYIAFAMIISTQSLVDRLVLLLAYNIVFVTPLILILVAMLGITRLSGIKDKLIKYSPHISLAGGILLVIVASLMVFQT